MININYLEKNKMKVLINKIKIYLLCLCISMVCSFVFSQSLYAQSFTVKGTVSDSKEPLVGVSVLVKGTTTGTSTGADGDYSIEVPNQNAVLVFSYLGYEIQEKTVGSQRTINVTLAEDVNMIDEVVVVGFGKQKKESVTGAITAIKASELRVPSSNLSSAFAGRLAGIVAVQRTGEPGADGASFWIRGISTFSGATNPLIFIDGVESSAADMNALSPEVIENFSVLMDATATALYGARGANGVMLITTRQGTRNQRAKINVRIEGQMVQPTKTVKLADGVTYMEMYNEAGTTRGGATTFQQDKIDGTRNKLNPLLYPNVDWQSFLFNDWSYNQTANINVTGGGDKVTYFMNASINNDNGMLKNDPQNKFNNNISQQRYSMQGNIAVDLSKTTKATIRLNTQIINYNGSYMSTADIYARLFISPGVLFPAYIPRELNPGAGHIMFGNKTGGPNPIGGANLYYNAYAYMVNGYSERSENTNTVSFEMEQDLKIITHGLKIRGLISFKNWALTNVARFFNPYFHEVNPDPSGQLPQIVSNALNNDGTTALGYGYGVSGDRLMNEQVSLEYARTFDEKHDVTGLLVYQQRDYRNNNPWDYYLSLPVRNQGIAGRVTYGYNSRYLAEANFGYNGSENFAQGKRFGFFPSFALGYNISNEAFWEPVKNVVSNLKLRASWGIVGNSEISTDAADRFPYLTKVSLSGRSFTFGDDWQTSRTGAMITRYGADDARWEKGVKKNIGFDMSLFKALDITLNVFNENRNGIFMQYRTLPVEAGISGDLVPYANLGKVRNEGFDLSLNYNKAFLNNELVIGARGTFTYAKNTLVDRDEPINTPEYRSELGKPLNVNTGLVALGLFKDQADADNSPTQMFGNYTVGDIKYKDLNEDGVIDGNDVTQIGNPTIPQIVWGAGVSASYKGFDFSLFFQGVGKTSISMGDIHPFSDVMSQLYQFIADDYWSESNPNPDAAYPRLTSKTSTGIHNNHKISTFWLRDGSFFRLKNIEAGYTYKFARLYLSGQNVFTVSNFKHWDPEVGGVDGGNWYGSSQARGLKYPPLRVFSLGLQLTF
jgi:TonB-linked SusC/RagA family outer membrane protein